MSSHAHPASERGGWGIRLHRGGASSLNCFSMGDVVAYDSKQEAERVARAYLKDYGPRRLGAGALYTNVTVEEVEKGAWVPSEYDATMLDLIEYAKPVATKDAAAARAINRAKALLSSYAPEHLRRPVPLPSEGDSDG